MPQMLIIATLSRTVRAFLLPIIEDLVRNGYQVDVACDREPGRVDDDAEIRGAGTRHIFDVPFSRSPVRADRHARAAFALRRVLDAGHYDLVHLHTPIAAAIARKIKPEDTRALYFAHGFHFSSKSRGATRLWRGVERRLVAATDNLVVLNEEDHATALSLGYQEHRVTRLNGIGLDLDRFAPVAQEAQLHRPRSVVVIGELNGNKDPLAAVQAVANTTDVHAHFLGRGPLEDAVRSEARRLGVDERIHLHGQVPDVRPYLENAGALLFLSHREGLPRAVLETVAVGLPVIAFGIRGVLDILNGHPWWYPPVDRSPVAVSQSIEEALMDRSPAADMRRSVEPFGLGEVVQAHSQLISEIMSRS